MKLKRSIFIDQLIEQSKTDDIVLVEKNQAYTATEILESSIKLADGLIKAGVTKNDTVVIATQPGIEFVRIIFATMLIGTKVALIDPDMGRESYRSKMKQLNPKWCFIDYRLLMLQEHPILRFVYFKTNHLGIYIPYDKNINYIATGKKLPVIKKHFKLSRLLKNGNKDTHFDGRHADDYPYIITYTSGTVNEPKGVLHSLGTIGTSISHIRNIVDKEKPQSLATHLPHYMLLGICTGIKVYVWDSKLSASQKITFLEKNRITTVFGPPAEILELINYCNSVDCKIPDSVEHIILGSAPIHIPFLEKLIKYLNPSTQITCMYGMTENLVVATIDGRKKVKYKQSGDLLGEIIPNVNVQIDENNQILIQSDQLHLRYLNQSSREEWHQTGDLGYIDNDGLLVLTGRKKDMIIRENFNIYPELYETTIKKIPGIEEVALVGKYDEAIADEKIYLFVESTIQYTELEILNFLNYGKYSIDKQAIPDHVIFKAIPRSGRQSKIDKNKLRSLI